MPTLYDQPPRQNSLASYMHWIHFLAPKFGFDPDKMKAADWHALCDLVRTALAIQNADVLDEQLGGFGDLLGNIGGSLSDIGDSLKDLNGGVAVMLHQAPETNGRQPE